MNYSCIISEPMTMVERCMQKWRDYDETIAHIRMYLDRVYGSKQSFHMNDLMHLTAEEKLKHEDCIRAHQWLSRSGEGLIYPLPRWKYELMPTNIIELIHTRNITQSEYRVMQTFTMNELKTLVLKNHHINPCPFNTRYKKNWAFSYLYTKRWAFNAFAIRSKLPYDVLQYIREFWYDTSGIIHEKQSLMHDLYAMRYSKLCYC
jgi:hypothetical protein